MRTLAVCIISTVFAALPCTVCVAQGVNLTLGGGGGDLDVDAEADTFDGIGDDDTFVGELGVGYRFANHVVIEGSRSSGFDLAALFVGGTSEFHETRVLAGYAFPATEKLRLVPTLGVSFWRLENLDDPFFLFLRIALPIARPSKSGTDVSWRLAGEYYFSPRFGAYLSYSGTRPNFGSFSLLSLGMKIQF